MISCLQYPEITAGKVPVATKLESDPRLGSYTIDDRIMFEYLSPQFDIAVREVLAEVQEDRLNGLVRPFVEGEPIGKYEAKPIHRHSDEVVLNYRRKERRWAHEEMLRLRAKNDAEMASFLRRV